MKKDWWDEFVETLPDPEVDKQPERVEISEEGKRQAEKDRAFRRSLLNPKVDTEKAVKYVLCKSPLFGADLKKDGDWAVLASGIPVYMNKISDYKGYIRLPGEARATSLFVEVKGISPFRDFSLSRLTRPNKGEYKSQQEKLTDEWMRGSLVWIALGWWDARVGAEPVQIRQKSRIATGWKLADVSLSIALLQWGDWLELCNKLWRKSIRQKDRKILDGNWISKVGRSWQLCPGHWWSMAQIEFPLF